MRYHKSLALAMLALFALSSAAVVASQYQVRNLPADAWMFFLNDRGELIRQQNGNVSVYNALTGETTGQVVLNDLHTVKGIDKHGRVLVNVDEYDSGIHGYREIGAIWDPAGGLALLPSDSGYSNYAVGFSNNGQVICSPDYPDAWRHAFLWSADRGVEDLGCLGDYAQAYAINDTSQVAGTWGADDGRGGLFLWSRDTGMADIGLIQEMAWPQAINNQGLIAGYCAQHSLPSVFVWDPTNGYRIIYTAPTFMPGPPNVSLNNNGTVMFAWGDGFYLWDEKTGVQHHVESDSTAYDINDSGMVIGEIGGKPVLWDPIPEPSSLLALVAGLGGLVGVTLRRRAVMAN
jgi:hypothetical protein